MNFEFCVNSKDAARPETCVSGRLLMAIVAVVFLAAGIVCIFSAVIMLHFGRLVNYLKEAWQVRSLLSSEAMAFEFVCPASRQRVDKGFDLSKKR